METQYDFYLFICTQYPYFLLSSLLRQISKYAHQKHVGPDDAGCQNCTIKYPSVFITSC